jgi:hypothetical protein
MLPGKQKLLASKQDLQAQKETESDKVDQRLHHCDRKNCPVRFISLGFGWKQKPSAARTMAGEYFVCFQWPGNNQPRKEASRTRHRRIVICNAPENEYETYLLSIRRYVKKKTLCPSI